MRYPIRGKNPLFWGFNLVWGTFPWSKSKNSFGFEFPMPKNPQYKKSAKLENFLKIRFFYPLVPPWGKKIEFLKSFPIWLIFCTGGFFGMGNSNLKEFFDFDHGKVPHTRLKLHKGGFYLVWDTSL